MLWFLSRWQTGISIMAQVNKLLNAQNANASSTSTSTSTFILNKLIVIIAFLSYFYLYIYTCDFSNYKLNQKAKLSNFWPKHFHCSQFFTCRFTNVVKMKKFQHEEKETMSFLPFGNIVRFVQWAVCISYCTSIKQNVRFNGQHSWLGHKRNKFHLFAGNILTTCRTLVVDFCNIWANSFKS